MSNLIPVVLQEAAGFLSNSSFELPSGTGDSRRDSGVGENTVVQLLQNAQRWKVTSENVGKSTNRAPYDMTFENVLVDIKISGMKGQDNTNAKGAIYYLLTGEDGKNTPIPTHNKPFWKSLKENENPDERRDFYYLIVNKNDTSDVFVVSLKHITKVTPASENPPFQAKWDDCRVSTKRTWEEAKTYLLGKWAESIKRKQESLKVMPTYYPEFFKEKNGQDA